MQYPPRGKRARWRHSSISTPRGVASGNGATTLGYHRHLQKFVGRRITIVEVGIYSGGSLDMWREYFGPECNVIGIDIEPACKSYEHERVRVFVGDQADPNFWSSFRKEVSDIDVLIDDGGHEPTNRSSPLQETLPHLSPGGVYICEDIHRNNNSFQAYVSGLCRQQHAAEECAPADGEQGSVVANSAFQSAVHSIHTYPFVTVIERHDTRVDTMVSPKCGAQW